MTCTNLNLRLYMGTLIGLLSINQTYALESAMTSGPSVGHRPVINGLVLGTARGDISQNTVPLYVGDVISRTGGTITDVDGDPVEAGEYCVWYRVEPNTNMETVVKDPGATDRSCEYTLQTARCV